MRWLPSLGRGRVETKGAIDRRHSAGPYYAFPGVPYEQPLRDMDIDRAVNDGWARDVWVYKAVHARATNAAGLDVRVMDGRGEEAKEIEKHPLAIRLNRKANKYETGQAFRYRLHTLLDLSLKGVFVEVIERNDGAISSLHLLNPKITWPVPDPDVFVECFEMRLPSGEVFDKLPPYERGKGGVLWIKRPHPTDPYSSSTWLQAAGLSVDLDHWARVYNRNFLFNDGRPGGVLLVKTEDGVETETAAELKRRMAGGPHMAGQTTVIEGEALDYVDLSTNPRDAQYVEGRAITKMEILAAAGTPESLWNASGRTFDNADAEYEGFWRNEMVNETEMVGSFWEELTEGGIEDDTEVVTYNYDKIAVLQRDARADEARAQAEFDRGLITADEYRDRTGKDPMDFAGTRVLWLAAGKAPVGDPKDVAELTGAPPPGTEPPPGQGALPPGGTPNALPPGTEAEAKPTTGEVIEGEVVGEDFAVLDESQYKANPKARAGRDPAARVRAAHARMVDGWAGEVARDLERLLRRQESVVLSRLTGTKARKHTRHWTYATPPAGEVKALDPGYVIERARWVEEVVAAVTDTTIEAYNAAAKAVTLRMGGSIEDFDPGESRSEAIARTVRAIAEGFDARAGRLQRVIADAEAAGASLDEIADKVRDAYQQSGTWARTSSREVVGAMNAASLIAALQSGATHKRWLATDDERTRPSHKRAEGQVVEVGHMFAVGGSLLRFPHDPAGPTSETLNCRCTMLFRAEPAPRDFDAELDADLAGLEAFEDEFKRFDEDQHPRDYRGRFLEKPGRGKPWLPDVGKLGRVLGAGVVLSDPTRTPEEHARAEATLGAFMDRAIQRDTEGIARERAQADVSAAARIQARLADPDLTPRTRRILETQLDAVFEEDYDPNPPEDEDVEPVPLADFLDEARAEREARRETPAERLVSTLEGMLADPATAGSRRPMLEGQLERARGTVARQSSRTTTAAERMAQIQESDAKLAAARAKAKAAKDPIGKLTKGGHATLASLDFPPEVAEFVYSTFERDDWPGGMRTEVAAATIDGGRFEVTGDLYAGNRVVGSFNRVIDLDKKTLTNENLRLDESVQGQGFAEAFYRRTETAAAAQGVKTVKIHADIDVGGYAWAQRGFGWDHRSTVGHISESLRARIARMSGAPQPGQRLVAEWSQQQRDEIGALYDHCVKARDSGKWEDLPSPKEIANVGRDTPWTTTTVNGVEIPMWPGKQLMLGSDWRGTKPIMAGFETKSEDPADWNRRVMASLDDAAAVFVPGDKLAPHDGTTSDLNLLLADLLLGPEEETKDFDPGKHPRDRRGRFASTGKVSYPHASYDSLGPKGRAAVDDAKATYGITDETLDAAVARNWDEHPAAAAAGQDWYRDQGRAFAERMAAQHDVPVEEAIGVIAATSPRARWDNRDGSPGANQLAAMDILANRQRMTTGDWKDLSDMEVARKLPVRVMSQFAADGVAIARGKPLAEHLGGPKRPAFHNAIADPDSDFDAPVDTYISRIAGYAATRGGGPGGTLTLDETKKMLGMSGRTTNGGIGHVLVGDALRRHAKRTGLAPSQVMAGWWMVERDFHPRYG